jgi:hypothetical protein
LSLAFRPSIERRETTARGLAATPNVSRLGTRTRIPVSFGRGHPAANRVVRRSSVRPRPLRAT